MYSNENSIVVSELDMTARDCFLIYETVSWGVFCPPGRPDLNFTRFSIIARSLWKYGKTGGAKLKPKKKSLSFRLYVAFGRILK